MSTKNLLYLYESYDVVRGRKNVNGFRHEERINHKVWITEDCQDKNYSFFSQTFEAIKEQPIYLLVVLYSDGGTFGRTDGYVHIVDIGNDYSEMKKTFQKIESGKYGKEKK